MTVPLITPYPNDVPNPFDGSSADKFTLDSFNFTTWQANDLGPDFNASVTQFNIDATQVNADAASAADSANTAASSANNAGLWSNLTGPANTPLSCNHNGSVWVLDANVADVTTIEPGVSGWTLASESPWLFYSSNFTVEAFGKYVVDGSSSTVDGALKTSYNIGDSIIVSNMITSTNEVKLTNTSLTIKGKNGDVAPGDNLIIEPGQSVQMVATTMTTLNIVGVKS